MLARAQRAHEAATIGQNELFGGGGTREPLALPQAEPWLPADRLQREYEAVGFFLSGHPLDDYAALLKRLQVQSWAEFSRAVKAGATAGRVAATVVSRQERRTKPATRWASSGCPIRPAHYEAVIFSEGLAEHRDLLEPGTAVLLFLSAEAQGDDVRARIQSVEPLDEAAANLQQGPARVPARREADRGGGQAAGAAGATAANGDGEVSMVLMLEQGTEVEVKLPGRFKVSPQIAGAIKAVPGVVRSGARPPLGRCLALHSQNQRLYKPAPSHTRTLAFGPDNGSKGRPVAAALRGLHTRPRRINRRRLWRFLTSPCVSFWKLASISAIRPTAGTRRWVITSSAPATTFTSSISPRACRCCIARCRR